MKERIYINNIVTILKELSDRNYQDKVWMYISDKPESMTVSFVEAVNMLFDDSIITDLLEQDEIIIDRDVTKAFVELSDAVNAVNEFRSEEEIINDPKMQIVREKAVKALELIEASDGSESTVEIVG